MYKYTHNAVTDLFLIRTFVPSTNAPSITNKTQNFIVARHDRHTIFETAAQITTINSAGFFLEAIGDKSIGYEQSWTVCKTIELSASALPPTTGAAR